MATARVRRGRHSQVLIAEWFRTRGWPQAESRPASLSGDDVLGMGDVSIEVKASSRFNLLMALRQAHLNAHGKYPVVVYRPDGFGPERIDKWIACMDLAEMTRLLQAAGLAQVEVTDEQSA